MLEAEFDYKSAWLRDEETIKNMEFDLSMKLEKIKELRQEVFATEAKLKALEGVRNIWRTKAYHNLETMMAQTYLTNELEKQLKWYHDKLPYFLRIFHFATIKDMRTKMGSLRAKVVDLINKE